MIGITTEKVTNHPSLREGVGGLCGRIAMAEGDYASCIHIYQQLLDDNPFSCEYWDNLATAQMQTDQYYDAITSCDYSLAISPDNLIALRNKANALYTIGDYEKAIENCNKHLEVDKYSVEIYYLRGRSYFEQKNFASALADFEKYVSTWYEIMSEGCYISESETNYAEAKNFCEQCRENLKNQ